MSKKQDRGFRRIKIQIESVNWDTSLNIQNKQDRDWIECLEYFIEYKIPFTDLQLELIEIYREQRRQLFDSR